MIRFAVGIGGGRMKDREENVVGGPMVAMEKGVVFGKAVVVNMKSLRKHTALIQVARGMMKWLPVRHLVFGLNDSTSSTYLNNWTPDTICFSED